MAAQYGENPQTDYAKDAESQGVTSFENLHSRYPELDGLNGLDGEQKIEVFRDVLEMLNEDLNSQQRV